LRARCRRGHAGSSLNVASRLDGRTPRSHGPLYLLDYAGFRPEPTRNGHPSISGNHPHADYGRARPGAFCPRSFRCRNYRHLQHYAPNYRELPEADLLAGGVAPWSDLPLWLPGESADLHRINNMRAIREGLTFLPLERTVEDIYLWRRQLDQPLRAGWSAGREAAFLK
jgi:hypothetical protein